MSFFCPNGFLHDIDGCICLKCHQILNNRHEWNGRCKCSKCGKTRDINHEWSYDCEKCLVCKKTREGAHQMVGCECIKCKKTFHEYHKSCECTKCGKKSHTSNDKCLCINCGEEAHEIVNRCTCKKCGRSFHEFINTNKIKQEKIEDNDTGELIWTTFSESICIRCGEKAYHHCR